LYQRTCAFAAEGGHLEVLKWAREITKEDRARADAYAHMRAERLLRGYVEN
jgi:hypothetical protein